MTGSAWRQWLQGAVVGVGVVCLAAGAASAFEVELDASAVKKAVEDGKQMKEIKTLPTRFGADLVKDLCGGGGEIQTKTVGLNRLGALVAADPERAERDKEKVDEAIKKTADAKRLKIVFDFCGDTADFAQNLKPVLPAHLETRDDQIVLSDRQADHGLMPILGHIHLIARVP